GSDRAAILVDPVVEGLEADLERGRGLPLVAAQLAEGGEDEAPLHLLERGADADVEARAGLYASRPGQGQGVRAHRLARLPAALLAVPLALAERPLHEAAQLADVARPALAPQEVERRAGEALARPLAAVQAAEEVLGQQLDVLRTVAERRHLDREHV